MGDVRFISYAGYQLAEAGAPQIDKSIIWNGTHELDGEVDWSHSGFGTETTDSKRSGYYGLDATSMYAGVKVKFEKYLTSDNIAEYDLLTFWVNLEEWQAGKEIEISLSNLNIDQGVPLRLSSYVNVGNKNLWQKAIIDLKDFNIPGHNDQGDPVYINGLSFTATGNIGLYFDDISFSSGSISRVHVPVYDPSIAGQELGTKTMSGDGIVPSIKGQFDTEDNTRTVNTFPPPKLG